MALPIDVKPYELLGSVGGDNYLSHYKGTNEKGEEFIVTEFFPVYMVKREEDGTLTFSERFQKEFVEARDDFVARAEALKEMRDVSIHPVVETFERNSTAYMVRRVCGLTTLAQYMGNQTMDFDEAYYFIRPLLLSMAQVAEKKCFFNIKPADFRVNSFKQLVLAAPPAWDVDFHPSLVQIMKLYYRIVTGVEPPDDNAPPFSAYGIEVPPRIEAMITEILGGDILYGSLDDFYKKFKSLMDGNTEADTGAGKRTLAIMRGFVVFLFVLFVLSLPVFVFAVLQARRAEHFWAEPDVFVDAYAPDSPEFDFSAIMLTHPTNTADPVHGTFATHDGFIYMRGENGLRSRRFGEVLLIPGAAAMLDDDRSVAEDVIPSFIVGHSRNVYFSNANAGGRIYRAAATGDAVVRITEYPAVNLAVVGDYLFYADVGENFNLSRLHLRTSERELIYPHPVRATLASGSYLFFVAHDDAGENSLLIWDTEAEEPVRRVATNAASSLRVSNNFLFYLDTDGRVRSMTFEGRHVETFAPENVRTFDVLFNWLFFTDERHVPRAYNKDTGEFFTLSTTVWASYLWAHGETVYALDHRNPMLVHELQFP